MDKYLLMFPIFFSDFQTYCNVIYGYVWIDSQDILIVSFSQLVKQLLTCLSQLVQLV